MVQVSARFTTGFSKGTVTVRHDVVVGHHGMLNTLTPGTFNVRGDVLVREHGVAGLGCDDEVGCAVESNNHTAST